MKKKVFFLILAVLPIALTAQTKMQLDSVLTYHFQYGDSTLVVSQIYQYNSEGILQKELQTMFEQIFFPFYYDFGIYHYTYNSDGQVANCIRTSGNHVFFSKEDYTYLDDSIVLSRSFPIAGYNEVLERWTHYGVYSYDYSPLLNKILRIANLGSNRIFYHSDSIIYETKYLDTEPIEPDSVFTRKICIYFSYDENDRLSSVTQRIIGHVYDYEFDLFYNQDNECFKIEAFEGSDIGKIKTDEIFRVFDDTGNPIEDYELYTLMGIQQEYETVYNYDYNGNIISEIKYDVNAGSVVEKKYYFYSSGTSVKENSTNYSISVYPNPAITQLHAETDNYPFLQTDYVIYNIMGQTVLQGKLQESAIINIESLAKGMYYLRISNATVKFVKD